MADKYLGQRNAVTIGGFTMMAGQLMLFAVNNYVGLYIGLFLIIIGNGFFKPNISTLVGGLYEDGDDRRDAAFSIFYMGINLGAFMAPLVVGFLTDNLFAANKVNEFGEVVMSYGYRYGFLAAAIGMFIGQMLFNTLGNKYLGDIGSKPGGSVVNGMTAEELAVNNKKPLTKEEKDRIIVIFVIFVLLFSSGQVLNKPVLH